MILPCVSSFAIDPTVAALLGAIAGSLSPIIIWWLDRRHRRHVLLLSKIDAIMAADEATQRWLATFQCRTTTEQLLALSPTESSSHLVSLCLYFEHLVPLCIQYADSLGDYYKWATVQFQPNGDEVLTQLLLRDEATTKSNLAKIAATRHQFVSAVATEHQKHFARI